MHNNDNAHTGNFARRSDKLIANETPAGVRTGSLAELHRRCSAWLEWRAGLAPKPAFKPYNERDRSTWFTHRSKPLRGAVAKQVAKTKTN